MRLMQKTHKTSMTGHPKKTKHFAEFKKLVTIYISYPD